MHHPFPPYEMDLSLSWEERYHELEAHHRLVCEWMHEEVEKVTDETPTVLVQYQRLHRRVQSLIDSDLSWEDTYDYVFKEYKASGLRFEWYDPDTTHQADVEAFVMALERKAGEAGNLK